MKKTCGSLKRLKKNFFKTAVKACSLKVFFIKTAFNINKWYPHVKLRTAVTKSLIFSQSFEVYLWVKMLLLRICFFSNI